MSGPSTLRQRSNVHTDATQLVAAKSQVPKSQVTAPEAVEKDEGRGRNSSLNLPRPPVKITFWKLVNGVVIFVLGTSKAISTYLGPTTSPITFEWISGFLWGLILISFGLLELYSPTTLRWLLQEDLYESDLIRRGGDLRLGWLSLACMTATLTVTTVHLFVPLLRMPPWTIALFSGNLLVAYFLLAFAMAHATYLALPRGMVASTAKVSLSLTLSGTVSQGVALGALFKVQDPTLDRWRVLSEVVGIIVTILLVILAFNFSYLVHTFERLATDIFKFRRQHRP